MTEFPDGTYCVIYSWIDFANKHWKTIIGREGENERLEGRKEGRKKERRASGGAAAESISLKLRMKSKPFGAPQTRPLEQNGKSGRGEATTFG